MVVPRGWHDTGDRLQRDLVLAPAESWQATQQTHGVGVARVGEQLPGGSLFDDPPRVHHPDMLTKPRDQAQVVTDQEDRRVDLAAELLDEVEHLRLHGGIEPRRRLVEHQQARVAGEGHGDDDALLLAAGELEGIAISVASASGMATRSRLSRARRRASAERKALVKAEHLCDLFTDPDRGVQGRARILVDHGELGAAELAEAVLGK